MRAFISHHSIAIMKPCWAGLARPPAQAEQFAHLKFYAPGGFSPAGFLLSLSLSQEAIKVNSQHMPTATIFLHFPDSALQPVFQSSTGGSLIMSLPLHYQGQ